MRDRKALLSQASELVWFHAIDFGDCQTPGRFTPGTPQNRTLFGIMDMLSHVDLTGLNCLDIGTVDGLIAFNMATRGAARVVATDVPQKIRPSFQVARELLDLDVELLTGTTFENIIDKLGEHTFDVVVCSGVMYHMLNPFDAILKARRLLKRNGIFLFQTRYHPDNPEAVLDFNPVSEKLDQIHIYFVPTKSAVTGMMTLGGFQTLGVRTGTKNSFIAVSGKNVNLDELTDSPRLIAQQHQVGIPYAEFKTDLPEESSKAIYDGTLSDEILDDFEYKPNFPPHPTESKTEVGARRISQSKNKKPK